MARVRSSWLVAGGALLVALVLAGPRGRASARPPIHPVLDMDAQSRAEPQAASRFFYDGKVMRPPVEGTVARGELHEGVFWTGMDPVLGFAPSIPVEVDDALRERGRRRFEIYCAICHDRNGDGKGLLHERAQVRTPSFHVDRLRQAPDGYYFLLISQGFGLMPSYAAQIPVADRWAIVAHVRELQARRVAREAEEAAP
jgi:mono/diheme cytochrome c family protein